MGRHGIHVLVAPSTARRERRWLRFELPCGRTNEPRYVRQFAHGGGNRRGSQRRAEARTGCGDSGCVFLFYIWREACELDRSCQRYRGTAITGPSLSCREGRKIKDKHRLDKRWVQRPRNTQANSFRLSCRGRRHRGTTAALQRRGRRQSNLEVRLSYCCRVTSNGFCKLWRRVACDLANINVLYGSRCSSPIDKFHCLRDFKQSRT